MSLERTAYHGWRVGTRVVLRAYADTPRPTRWDSGSRTQEPGAVGTISGIDQARRRDGLASKTDVVFVEWDDGDTFGNGDVRHLNELWLDPLQAFVCGACGRAHASEDDYLCSQCRASSP